MQVLLFFFSIGYEHPLQMHLESDGLHPRSCLRQQVECVPKEREEGQERGRV